MPERGERLAVAERDVSATASEFAHGLHLAFPGLVEGGPWQYAITHGPVRMEIALTPGPDRVIALLRLATLKVRISFTAGTRTEQQAMLHRMDLAMRRGGG